MLTPHRARSLTFAIALCGFPLPTMALSNVGTLVLNILIFITTLVNFNYALTTLDSVTLLVLWAISRIFVTPPEEGMLAKCQLKHLYSEG